MKMKKYLLACLLAFFTAHAQALPVYNGSYGLSDASSTHGIWFNNAIRVGRAGDNTFNLKRGSFNVNGTNAVLRGRTWSDTLRGGFDFRVRMEYLCTGTVLGGCGGLGQQPDGRVDINNVLGNDWDFWNYVDNDGSGGYNYGRYRLTGTGSLSGVTFVITQKPQNGAKPFRFGIGADWFNDFSLGGSGWFDVVRKRGGNNVNYRYVNRGDFNVRAVPEPSIIALFGLGLLGLVIARRKVRS